MQKSGAWYSVGETRIGQGREAARAFLAGNPELSASLEAKLRESLALASKSEPDES